MHIRKFIQKQMVAGVVLSCLLLSLSGCVYLIVGGIGALGGYVVSPDTVEGITENDFLTVWDTAVEIIAIMGLISEEYEDGGVIYAKVSGAKVTVTISSVNESLTRVNIKARKAFLPKITVAQDVFVKIMSQLQE